jgi:hypothetical protein
MNFYIWVHFGLLSIGIRSHVSDIIKIASKAKKKVAFPEDDIHRYNFISGFERKWNIFYL